MALSTVTVTWTEQDIGEGPLSGTITFTLSQVLTDVTDGTVTETKPLPFRFVGGAGSSDPLVANDSPSVIPSGTWYTIGVSIEGQPARSFTAPILAANGGSQTLAFLQSQAIVPVVPMASYLETTGGVMAGPLVVDGGLTIEGVPVGSPPGGTTEFLRGDGTWDVPPGSSGSGTVTSVAVVSANGLAGTVASGTTTPQVTLSTTVTGLLRGNGTAISAATAGTDYLAPSGSGAALTGITAAQAGADASGAAAAALTAAESFATTAVGTETGRAETAEALLAPLASPALTGTPTAPTATPLTDSTRLATTAYADTAVAVETSRAATAEALLAPKASPALTGTPTAPTATALTDSTQVATTAYADSAVAAETSRAEAAEVLKAPLASPALTGTPTAPTAPALTSTTRLATTAYADAAVAVETGRAETAEGLALQKASNLSDLASAATARTSLGLGTAAVQASSAFDAAGAAAAAASASVPLAGGAMTGALVPAVVALTDASTVGLNAALGNDFRLTMTSGVGSTRQLGTPSGPVDGQRITVQVTQDSSGSQLLTYTSAWDWGTAGSPTLSTAAGAVDVIAAVYNGTKGKWLAAIGGLGF